MKVAISRVSTCMLYKNKLALCESTPSTIFYETINIYTAEVNGDFNDNSADYIA